MSEQSSENQVVIFDTTTRDGEQAGHKMSRQTKVDYAQAAEQAGVDVLEAGFPISSPGDAEAVQAVAAGAKRMIVAALARTVLADVEAAWAAIKAARRPRIHTFISTSDIHMEKKLRKDSQTVLEMAVKAVRCAKSHCSDVEFSPEDSARTGIDFLCRIVEAVIDAGATTVNIPDTVGYSNPWDFGALITTLRNRVPNIDQAVISVHCHNDQGLAVANSLAGIRAGARQVEGCFIGIGERAGNAALEEVVMNLVNNPKTYGVRCGIDTKQIGPLCRRLSRLIGHPIPGHKAIVGPMAFAHSSGIHRDGVIKDPATYEVMTPESVGWVGESMQLVSHLGRNGLADYLSKLSYDGVGLVESVYPKYLELADVKGTLSDEDLHMIVQELRIHQEIQTERLFDLPSSEIHYGEGCAKVKVARHGTVHEGAGSGDGAIAAVIAAITAAIKCHGEDLGNLELTDYSTVKGEGGPEAIGWTVIQVRRVDQFAVGRSGHTDVVKAAGKAFVYAINNVLHVPAVAAATATRV